MPRIVTDYRTDEEIARERRLAINATLNRRMDRLTHALEDAELATRRTARAMDRAGKALERTRP